MATERDPVRFESRQNLLENTCIDRLGTNRVDTLGSVRRTLSDVKCQCI
jgi:hypothetical protein